MPIPRILWLIFSIWLLLAAAGCQRIARLLDLSPAAQPPQAQALAGPPQANRAQTHCCWCIAADSHQNSVQAYVSRDMCEDRAGNGEFESCRGVHVNGSVCSLVKVRAQGGRLHCTPNPLRYEEGGEQKTIAPPEDYDLTCHARVLVRAAQARTGVLIENTDPNAPPEDVYCSCEGDLDNPANCRVVKYARGLPTVLDSHARRPGQGACTRDVCFSIFDENAFRANCPRYVDGEP